LTNWKQNFFHISNKTCTVLQYLAVISLSLAKYISKYQSLWKKSNYEK